MAAADAFFGPVYIDMDECREDVDGDGSHGPSVIDHTPAVSGILT